MYEKLQPENKYLFTKLENTREVKENSVTDSFEEEIPRKRRKISKVNTHNNRLYSKNLFLQNKYLSKM